jgi:hypothetical protein
VIPLSIALAGCDYSDGRHGVAQDDHQHNQEPGVASAGIDADATLVDIQAGRGTGLFVEYQSGGSWRIFTSCDTELSGFACTWDVIVTPIDAALESVRTEDLERDDFGGIDGADGRLISDNDFDFDGIVFASTPGAAIRLDVFLDGAPGGKYVYWVENGGLHRGAPTNPVDLIPSAP